LSISANADASGLLSPQGLLIPVEGIRIDQLTDTFDDARAAGRTHDAIDIMAPRGTHVLAVADGKVVKLFTSVRGGLTVYQFDPTKTFCYYYAHLDSYAPGLLDGKQLRRGDLIGFVGSSGDANPVAPHLHFEIHVLGPEKNWWQGTAINPYPILTGRHPNVPQPAAAPTDPNRH
jgi:murein DD-endopeptidase MepM/ murein hydrolase activator NlpD